jgi:hypothetical protein
MSITTSDDDRHTCACDHCGIKVMSRPSETLLAFCQRLKADDWKATAAGLGILPRFTWEFQCPLCYVITTGMESLSVEEDE